jgi:hypothetical protein
MKRLLALIVLLAPCVAAEDAAAAESYDNCRGYITALPVTLTTQGTWCLKTNLTTNIASGNAILVQINNVTIDCNGYRIFDQAGTNTQAAAIRADSYSNLTLRGCNIRGFKRAVDVSGAASSGHVIEDNRFEVNYNAAIALTGTSHVVRRNQFVDSGGQAAAGETFAVIVGGDADVVDNNIDGVHPSSGGTQAGSYGVWVTGSTTSTIRGNTIRNINGGNSADYAISVNNSTYAEIVDNHLQVGAGGGNGNFGIYCSAALKEIVAGNRMFGYGIPLVNCDDDGGNLTQN